MLQNEKNFAIFKIHQKIIILLKYMTISKSTKKQEIKSIPSWKLGSWVGKISCSLVGRQIPWAMMSDMSVIGNNKIPLY